MSLKKAMYEVPESKKLRVIVDTDCNCEADDYFAVVHTLMTPKFEVMAVVAEHYGNGDNGEGTAITEQESYREAKKVVELMKLTDEIPVLEGCREQLPDEKTFVESPASRFIVEEAMKEDSRPLYILNQGALTNLASAYLMEPRIAGRIKSVWIGGASYPEGGWEFNLINDINAVNVMMDSQIEIWQVPQNVYSMMRVSFASLFDHVYPYGEIGKYMMDKLMEVNHRMSNRDTIVLGEVWQLGDSPSVGLLLHDQPGYFSITGAPRIEMETGRYILRQENERKIRVYHNIDSQFILEDFFSKIKYYFG